MPATEHRILRKAKMTQTELAAKLGISSAAISYILRGQRNPPFTLAYRIAKELRISLDALYRSIHPPNRTKR